MGSAMKMTAIVAVFAAAVGMAYADAPAEICGAPRLQARAELIWTKPLCKEPDRYIGWPSVCQTRDGEILAVFSGDRDAHVCPWGKVQMVRSKDGGATWTAPEDVCDTIIDDRDAGIVPLDDGSLLMSWFTSTAYVARARNRKKFKPGSPEFYWNLHVGKSDAAEMIARLGSFTRRSVDGGKTWSAPVRVRCSAPHGPIQLKDGRLLYVGKDLLFEENDVYGHLKPDLKVVAMESKDRGATWRQIGTIPFPKDVDVSNHCWEPHAAEAADGRIVAQIRVVQKTKGPDGKKKVWGIRGLMQSESADGGRTWSVAREAGLAGYPPHLTRLADGRLLSTYGRRWGDSGEYACLSDDGGRTWDVKNEIKLAGHWNGDLGYPASVQLKDGTVLTVFYQADKKDEKPCLIGTLWRPLK